MIILMAVGAEPEIEHLINRRSRNHRSAKIASIAPWRSAFKIGRKLGADSRQGFGGRGVGDKVAVGEE